MSVLKEKHMWERHVLMYEMTHGCLSLLFEGLVKVVQLG